MYSATYSLLATAIFVFGSLVVSARLLALARRRGQTPELCLGLGILGTAVLGYGTLIAGVVLRGDPSAPATGLTIGLTAAGRFLHNAGVSMMLLFVLTVFRSGVTWARVLAGALFALLWVGLVGSELEDGFRTSAPGNAFWWMQYAVIWTYPLWSTIESYRYYGIMRRRRALGLADPIVTNRFWLWGTGSIGTTLSIWIASVPFFLAHDPALLARWSPVAQVVTATIGLVTVSVYYLTFYPPEWYRGWVLSSQPAGDAP